MELCHELIHVGGWTNRTNLIGAFC